MNQKYLKVFGLANLWVCKKKKGTKEKNTPTVDYKVMGQVTRKGK